MACPQRVIRSGIVQAGNEDVTCRFCLKRTQQPGQFTQLLENQVGTQRLRGVEYLLGERARLLRLALSDQDAGQQQLTERPAPRVAARPELDDALGVVRGGVQLAELDLYAARRRPRVGWVQEQSRAAAKAWILPPEIRNATRRDRGDQMLQDRYRPLIRAP